MKVYVFISCVRNCIAPWNATHGSLLIRMRYQYAPQRICTRLCFEHSLIMTLVDLTTCSPHCSFELTISAVLLSPLSLLCLQCALVYTSSRLYTIIACVLSVLVDPIYYAIEKDDRVAIQLGFLEETIHNKLSSLSAICAQVWKWLAGLVGNGLGWMELRSKTLRAAYTFVTFFDMRCLRVARKFLFLDCNQINCILLLV